jgi:hypothetical protein
MMLLEPFERKWNTRSPLKKSQKFHPSRRLLTANAGLALALHYLRSTCSEYEFIFVFGILESSITTWLWFSLELLLESLKEFESSLIKFPCQKHRERYFFLLFIFIFINFNIYFFILNRFYFLFFIYLLI